MLLQSTLEAVSSFASLGVGGALASAIFYFYREDRKRSEATLLDMAARYKELSVDFKQIIQENTKAVTTLSDVLKEAGVCPYSRNGRDE